MVRKEKDADSGRWRLYTHRRGNVTVSVTGPDEATVRKIAAFVLSPGYGSAPPAAIVASARTCSSCAGASAPIGPTLGSQFGPRSRVTTPSWATTLPDPLPPRASVGWRVSRRPHAEPRCVSACHCEPSTQREAGTTENGSFSSPAV